MMLRLILRKSSLLSSTRLLPSASSSLLSSQILSPATEPPIENRILYNVQTTFFHSKPSRLDFIHTNPSNANTAAENSWFDVEKSPRESKGGDDGLDIDKLGIADEIVSTLASRGIVRLFPIQRAVLEPAMAGRDMYGRARTGTGKTLAFGIPILDKIIAYNKKHGRGKYPLALVLAPTRELARQVEKEFHDTAPSLDMICVYGGTPINRQMRELDYGVDVVVGTPGRIIDLMKRGSLNLEEVQFVVIDEADQMLNVGFVDDVEVIFQRLPNKRHSMLFSATMPSWIRTLIRKYLKEPLTIDLVGEEDQKLADGISLFSIESDTYGKPSILVPLITEHAKGGKCIVFTQTKRDADRLADALARKLKCEALHGDISQAVRERTLAGFRNGYFNVLVATDVAARGLDIPNVDLVVHYEIPNSSETFVHRSGRTGRAGKKGTAILIYTDDQSRQKKIFEREIGCKFTELPRVEGDASVMGFSTRMRSESRYGGFGGQRDRGSRFSGSNRFDDFGRSSGEWNSGDAFSRFGNSNRRESGGDRRRDDDFGGFGDFGSRRPARSGGFANSESRRDDDFGGFGDFGSRRPARSGGFANSESRSSNRRF